MRNILGHDHASEILTIITRMRENRGEKITILNYDDNSYTFKITLTHHMTVPTPHTEHTEADYILSRKDSTNNLYEYTFQQINGEPPRIIDMLDGFIIWGLLEMKFTGDYPPIFDPESSDNIDRKRYYGLRIGDIVLPKTMDKTYLGGECEVVQLGYMDNNRVQLKTKDDNFITCIAEWCKIIKKVEDVNT